MAQSSFDHALEKINSPYVKSFIWLVNQPLELINRLVGPVLNKILPDFSPKAVTSQTFRSLLLASFTVPFILGLDDFAGYISLFNIVNVFGFAIGVFLGHMILNICLYLSPQRTIILVQNYIIAVVGGLVFVGLGAWGLIEVGRLILLG